MKSNIVIINPDQMRADSLHHLGNDASYTPNIDLLASEGVSFKNAFCQNTVCVPSRCSFMTGLYPHVNGHRTMANLLKSNESNLLKELKSNGYYVWMNGRGDLISGEDKEAFKQSVDEECQAYFPNQNKCEFSENRGEFASDTYFSHYRGEIKGYENNTFENSDVIWTKQAIEKIKNRDKNKPFCLFLALQYPHPPYMIEKKYLDKIDVSKLPRRIPTLSGEEKKSSMIEGLVKGQKLNDWSEDRFNALRATYLAMCAKVDELTGMIVDTLKNEGVFDDTAVFLFSDHGDYTGDYGVVEKAQNSFEDCLTNIPLIIKPPKNKSVDKGVNENLVELIDFYATAIEYAEIDPQRTYFGQSLTKTIANKCEKNREFVTCEGGRMKGESHCSENLNMSLSSDMDEYLPRMNLQKSEKMEHTKATMLRTADWKYVKRYYESDELYNLKEDKFELNNLINDENYKDKVLDFKDKMLNWYMATCDVVPYKEDARFSDEDMLTFAINAGMPKPAIDFAKNQMANGKSFKEVMSILRK